MKGELESNYTQPENNEKNIKLLQTARQFLGKNNLKRKLKVNTKHKLPQL